MMHLKGWKQVIAVGTFILSSLPAIAAHSATIADSCRALYGDCAYYLCRESQDDCGVDGYLIDFGYRYCSAYKETQPQFTARGQEWMSHIRSCLMEELEQSIAPRPLGCREIRETAIASHFTCYDRYDFCSLPVEDKARLLWVAKAQLKDPSFVRNLTEMAEHCRRMTGSFL